jgi:serine phosphatase RsbU (regulator of sigma subunit)
MNGHSILTRNRFLVRDTFRYVSSLGTGYTDKLAEIRTNALSNQINFVVGISMAVLGLVLQIRLKLLDREIGIGVMRVWFTFVLCFFNLVLAHFKFQRISKYSLIFIPPLVFLIIPILSGFVEEEGYTYNAYVLISASIIPQLLLSSEKEKFPYWFAMTYYFLLILFIDKLAFLFQGGRSQIAELIKNEFYFIFKLAHLAIFFFINVSIFHLRKVNFRFEARLDAKNQILNIQNEKLKENEKKILQQKEIIELSSRAITDSISYAAMIQQAVLQPPDFLNDWNIPNFILYKPKAVVSGDFYWGIKRKDSFVIVAADCTGHGVPGAFMSMLGLAFLDDIHSNNELRSAAEILNLMREHVTKRLKQKGSSYEMKDGMDISACIINRAAGKLEFAGANNPLYIIRDGNLKKIPADKMPIGIYSLTQIPFKNNVIDLKIDDRIYLFSDGYADQFGGEHGRKLMYKQFQELLLKNHTEPMEMQKISLDKHFEEWKGEHDQVDDVLVVGIQI